MMPYKDPERQKRAVKRARALNREQYLVAKKEYEKTRRRMYGFRGVDGEGATISGRHEYMMLRAGDELLFTGKPLTPAECLPFIADLPKGNFRYVAFAFDYDVTMMLRDVRPDRIERLLDRTERGWHPIDLPEYGVSIDWVPRKFFRVKHLDADENETGVEISDVFGFFQQSFVKTLDSWDIGTYEQREHIARLKAERSEFQGTQEEIAYNALECELLSDLMDKVKKACVAIDMVPRKWQGAGQLADAMFRSQKSPDRDVPIPPMIYEAAEKAYYGGRFETFAVGDVDETVYENDINSAYPAAMLTLPCLYHGRWVALSGRLDNKRIFSDGGKSPVIAHVEFSWARSNDSPNVCPLPVRTKGGVIAWPQSGRGWYWHHEIRSAIEAGWTVKILAGWRYEQTCEEHPFGWVSSKYRQRRELMITNPDRGKIMKLGTNSLYGKTAQTIGGGGRWTNMVYAGLITSYTRSLIQDAANRAPDDILMIATDGIYSRVPLSLDHGEGLGQWEQKTYPGMMIVQPGLYLPNGVSPKTRGVPRAVVSGAADRIREAWHQGEPEFVLDGINTFIGLRLAYARGKPETAGSWVNISKTISFDPRTKREKIVPVLDHTYVMTTPYEKTEDFESSYIYDHQASDQDLSFWMREHFDAQPDFVPFLAHRA